MGHQPFDAVVNVILGREHNRPIVHIDRALGQIAKCLIQNAKALPHLTHPDEITGIGIAILIGHDIPVELVVIVVGMRLANVIGNTGSSQTGTGEAILQGRLFADRSDSLGTVNPNPVVREQAIHVIQRARQISNHFAAHSTQPSGRSL